MRRRWRLILPLCGLALFLLETYASFHSHSKTFGNHPTRIFYWSFFRLDSEPLSLHRPLLVPCKEHQGNCRCENGERNCWQSQDAPESVWMLEPGLASGLLMLTAFPAFAVGWAIVRALAPYGISEVTSFLASTPILILAWFYSIGFVLDRRRNGRPPAVRQKMSVAKWVLPLAQMALAVGLMLWSEFRVWKGPMIPGLGHWALLQSINAPAAFVRNLFWVVLPNTSNWFGRWNDVLLVAGIGALWYWVTLNIESWRRCRTVAMFRWLPLRLFGDALLVGVGIVIGLQCLMWQLGAVGTGNVFLLRKLSWELMFIASTVLNVGWFNGLVWLFTRDFVISIARRRHLKPT